MKVLLSLSAQLELSRIKDNENKLNDRCEVMTSTILCTKS